MMIINHQTTSEEMANQNLNYCFSLFPATNTCAAVQTLPCPHKQEQVSIHLKLTFLLTPLLIKKFFAFGCCWCKGAVAVI